MKTICIRSVILAAAVLAAIVVGHVATKAIAQAAHDTLEASQ